MNLVSIIDFVVFWRSGHCWLISHSWCRDWNSATASQQRLKNKVFNLHGFHGMN